MKFYRISHKTAKSDLNIFAGPYAGKNYDVLTERQCDALWSMAGAHSNDRHPTHVIEYMGGGFGVIDENNSWIDSDDAICGFESVTQALDWFSGWFTTLHKCGYVMREYNLPSDAVAVGEYQAVAHLEALQNVKRAARVLDVRKLDWE